VRIERLATQHAFTPAWTAFPLHAETPDQGRRLDDLFAAHPGYLKAMQPRLQAAARELGVNLPQRTHTYNSRRAHVLAKWAEAEQRGAAFHRAVYRAYFEQGRNLADPAELLTIAVSAGLDPDHARQALCDDRWHAAIASDWQRCRELGISAVPTFLCDGRRRVGLCSPAELRELLGA